MNLQNPRDIDPNLLIGLVNTELRNHCPTLEDLVKTHHLDRQELEALLRAAGYEYRPEQNQFR